MKTNKAPEKIWIAVCGKDLSYEWHSDSEFEEKDHNDIEYIRKDVFIEKAAEWLKTHSEADYFELIPTGNYCGAGNLNKKKMIEDFKKYMEEQS